MFQKPLGLSNKIRLGITILFLSLLPAFNMHAEDSGTAVAPLDSQEDQRMQFIITPAEKAWIKAHPVIRVSNESDWEPFDFRIGDQPSGYSIDLINLLAARIGIRLDYIGGYSWNELLELFFQHKIDVLHSLAKNPEREKHGLFTMAYHHSRLAFVTLKNQPSLNHFEQLHGKSFALIKGWWFEEFIRKEHPEIKVLSVKTLEEALDAVQNEQVYATADFETVARYKIEKLGYQNLCISGSPVEFTRENPASLHILVRKDWPELQHLFDKAFLALGPDEIRQLNEKWFGRVEKAGALPLSLTEEEKAYIKVHPVLKVGYKMDAPPLEFISQGKGQGGITWDYLKRISEILGMRFEPAGPRPWKDMLTAVRKGEIDFLPAVNPTKQRREWLDFSDPYLAFPIVIVTHREGPYIGNIEALSGGQVAVVEGDSAHDFLSAGHPELSLVPVMDVRAGLTAVDESQAFAFIGNLATVSHIMSRESFSDLKISGETPYKLEIAMGVPKEQTVLLSLLGKALAAIPPQEREAIHAKWFRVTFEHKVDASLVWGILISALLLISMVLYWNRRLRQMARELKKSEDNYRSIFNTANDAIFVHDIKTGRIINVNDQMLAMFGFERKEEVIGTSLAQFSANETPYTLKEAVELVRRAVGGEPQLFEWRARDKNGRMFWVEVSIKKVLIGGEEYIISIVRDIGERKKAGEKLARSEQRLAETQQIAQLGSWELNVETREIQYSDEALRIAGLTAEEIISLDDYLKRVHPADLPLLKKTVRESGQSNTAFEIELRHLQADGSYNYTLVRGRPVLQGDRSVQFIGSILDITERMQNEVELRQTKEAAEAASRAKSIFLTSMSHELRTPLNVILGFSELMSRDANLAPEQQEKLATIGRSGEYLLSLINDLLELSKIEAGKATLNNENTDLHRVLSDMEAMFSLRAGEKGLALEFKRAAAVPRFIQVDRIKLKQILINLLGNAVKFTHQGRITLEVTMQSAAGENPADLRHVLGFEIRDTGIGIPAAEQQKVFDAFYQTPAGAYDHQGTGLGLSISQRFVRMLGGELKLESVEGQGSRFFFHIPVEIIDQASMQSVLPGTKPPAEIRGDEGIRSALADLPPDVNMDLKTAVAAVDFDKTIRIIERIGLLNGPLAEAIRMLVNAYRFDTLQDWLDNGKKPAGPPKQEQAHVASDS